MGTAFLKLAAADAVQAFVKAKLGGQTDQAAADAASDSLDATLRSQLDPSGSLQKWKPLALPLADLAADGAGTTLPVATPSASHEATAGDWTWKLKAEASTQLVADVLDAGQLALLEVPARDGHQVVRYALSGALSAGATGGTSAGVWNLKAGADASASAAIEWYIAAPSQKRLGEALVEALPFFLPPMSLGDQIERAGDFEYWGSTVELNGGLSASFEAAASASATGWTWGFDGERAKLGLSLGVSGSARLQLAGKFRLRCIVKEAGQHADGSRRYGVEVTLQRLSSQEQDLALSLSAGLDATALAASADRFLRSHLPDPAQVSASLALITNPGTALGDKLKTALATKLATSPFRDLLLLSAGFGDPAALAKSLAARVAQPLMDEIDRLGSTLTQPLVDVDALLARWTARAFGPVPLATAQLNSLKALVSAQVGAAHTQLTNALDSLAASLENSTLNAASGLLAPFASFGEKVQARLTAVANRISASEAAQAVKDGLADYTALRDQVLQVLGDAQRAKISLSLAASLEVASSSEIFFRGVFVAATPPAERLFQALWSGRTTDLLPLVAEVRASGAFAGEPEGWLMRAAQRVRRESVTISLLGTDLQDAITRTSHLKLVADVTGNVLATADGGVEALVKNYWTERHAQLVLSIVRNGTAAPALSINGAFSAQGRDITTDMFNGLQRTLMQVYGGSSTLDIRRLLKAPDGQSMSDKDFRGNVGFLLPITLQPGECDAFLAASPQSLRQCMVTFGLRAMDAEYGDDWSEPPTAFLTGLARALKGQFGSETDHLAAYLDRFPARWLPNASRMDSRDYENLGLDPTLMTNSTFGSPLHRQLGKLYRLSRMLHAIVELQVQCARLSAVLSDATLASLEQAEQRARQPLAAITEALAAFSVASQTLVGVNETVSWPFAAFAATLAQSCGRPVPPGFIACAVLPGQDHQPVPLIAA